MISENQLSAIGLRFYAEYRALNTRYLSVVARHIGDMGKLSKTDIHRVTEILRMRQNTAAVTAELLALTARTAAETNAALSRAAKDEYELAKALYRGREQVPFAKNVTMQRLFSAEVARTSSTLLNLSRSTVQTLGYTRLVDTGIRAVTSGLADYHSVIRSTVRQFAAQGITSIDYESGITRRLDSAVRMNILEGVRSLAIEVAQEAGKEYGADGVEISAHAISAPDHEDIQGLQFTNAEFEQLQATLDRPIGELNCRHIAFPIVLGISQPAHDQEQLREYRERSQESIDIDGQERTRYEWTQGQRQLETAIRGQKDVRDFMKASGDDVGYREAKSAIKDLSDRYSRLSDKIGVPERKDLLR